VGDTSALGPETGVERSDGRACERTLRRFDVLAQRRAIIDIVTVVLLETHGPFARWVIVGSRGILENKSESHGPELFASLEESSGSVWGLERETSLSS
jgi:hypothetical protein